MSDQNSVFAFACPHCGQVLESGLEEVGKEADCPACGMTLAIPSPDFKTDEIDQSDESSTQDGQSKNAEVVRRILRLLSALTKSAFAVGKLCFLRCKKAIVGFWRSGVVGKATISTIGVVAILITGVCVYGRYHRRHRKYDTRRYARSYSDERDAARKEARYRQEESHAKSSSNASSKISKGEELYIKGKKHFLGEGALQDYARAFRCFSEASEQGFTPADSWLAVMRYDGCGCEKDRAKSYGHARKGEVCGSQSEESRAKMVLGLLYLFGFKDTNGELIQSTKKAYDYFCNSKSFNNSLFCKGLIEYGGIGALDANSAAESFYELCAGTRYPNDKYKGYAAMCLGQLYYMGEGVSKNEKEAWKWLRKGVKMAFPELLKAAKEPISHYDVAEFNRMFGGKISFWTPFSWKMYNLYKGKGIWYWNNGVERSELLENALMTLFNPDRWLLSVEYNFDDM